MLDSGARRAHSSVACLVECRICFASYRQHFFADVGGARVKFVGGLILKYYLFKCTNKPVKRFQMKSNGCRDVQHTGLQSTRTRRNTGKQGDKQGTLSTSSQASLHQWLYDNCRICIILINSKFEKLLGC